MEFQLFIRVFVLGIILMSFYVFIVYGATFAFATAVLLFLFKEKFETYLVVSSAKKCVFITGCDSGFGYTSSLLLAKKGFTIFAGCLYPKSDGLKELERNSNIHILHLDVTSDTLVDSCVVQIKELLGAGKQLWAVVNNAGICTDISLNEWTDLSYYQRCFEVNALGVVRVTRACLPLLRRSGRGTRVVTVTSLASRLSPPHYGAYSMSKFAAQAFCSSLRSELHSQGIHVITIEPNVYRTPLLDVQGYVSRAKRDFSKMDAEKRAVYQDVANSMHRLVPFLFSIAGSDMSHVPSAVARAVTELAPRPAYDSCLSHRFLRLLCMFFPTELVDLTTRYQFAMGYKWGPSN